MRANRSERGQALVLIIFVIVGLIGITALAVDGGLAYADRRQAQTAADSAALAASLSKIRGGNYVSAAVLMAENNGYNNDGERSVVEVHSPPISGPYKSNREYVQVIITSNMPTYFGSVVGMKVVTNRTEAVSRARPPYWGEILSGNAVISLAPTSDCNRFKAFWVHGEGTLALEGGGIFINSKNRACAFMQQGNGSVFMMDRTLPFGIVGGASIQKIQLIQKLGGYRTVSSRFTNNKGHVNSTEVIGLPFLPSTGIPPISYPPPFILPKIGCGIRMATISADGHSMSAGNWDGDFPPDGVTELGPGVYCINGNVQVKGQLNGNNIVLKVESGSVHFSGGARVDLQAPHSGPLKGLLLYLPIENHQVVVLNAGGDSKISGTILAPASLIRITGNDSNYGFHSQIIGYRVEVDGDSLVFVKYYDDQNYDALNNPEVQISQ
jgi:hypothetical protein